MGLAGEKYILPNTIETDAVSFLGTPVLVGTRAVEVVNAKVIHFADVRCRCRNMRMQIHPSTALRDDAHLNAGLAEGCGGDVARLHFFYYLAAAVRVVCNPPRIEVADVPRVRREARLVKER